jgi:arylsulfatase A-like enzyme
VADHGESLGEHGVDKNPLVIPEEIPVLAEELAAAGYQTAAFVSNPVLTPEKGYARGFSTYVLEPDAGGVERVNDAFFEWAETVDWGRPVFVWIHYMDPHGPYTPPAPFSELFVDDAIARADTRRVPLEYQPLSGFPPSYVLGAMPDYQRLGDEDRAGFYIAGYDEEIRYMDTAFGKLLQSLRDRDVYDGAAIAFVADHGESLGEHEYWFEHGWFAFDDALRIPFFVKPPRATTGRTVAGVVTTLDLKPTLFGFPGLATQRELSGRDLMKSEPGNDAVIVLNAANYPERFVGLRTPAWKYLRRLRMSGPPVSSFPAEQLYDLRTDPAEANDLSSEQPERVASLRAELDRQLAALGPRAAAQAVQVVDPALREKLRALGYTE